MGIISPRINVSLATPSKLGSRSVILRLSFCNKQYSLYTGISVQMKEWDLRKRRVKHGCVVKGVQYHVLNAMIDKQISFISEYFSKAIANEESVSYSDLKNRFVEQFKNLKNQSESEFFKMFEAYIEETSRTRRWDSNMIEKHRRLMFKIKNLFPNIAFDDLSTATMNDILQDWGRTMYNETIKNNLSCFRGFISWVERKGCHINPDFGFFNPKLPDGHKEVRALTLNEVKQIFTLPLEDGCALDRVRDLFCFQCCTGLRYSDISQLKKENVKKDDKGRLYMWKVTEKDDDWIQFPLGKMATLIYAKYCDNEYPDGLLFPVLSNQKYNKYLKKIGQLAELQGEWIDYQYKFTEKIIKRTPRQNLESHIGRRTFVSILLNAGGPVELISMVTSHSDAKSMAPYKKLSMQGTGMLMGIFDEATKDFFD